MHPSAQRTTEPAGGMTFERRGTCAADGGPSASEPLQRHRGGHPHTIRTDGRQRPLPAPESSGPGL